MAAVSARTWRLVGVAVTVAVATLGLWGLGVALSSSLLRFVGLMIGATTFVPLPADTFVLAASRHDQALVLGLTGGLINATMVLVERHWIRILVDHPAFDRFITFFDDNRLVERASRQMFLGLVVGGASFIPFEPFRLLAVLKNYSPVRYWWATFLSRGGRYYVLALVGEALLQVGVLTQALWISLALFLVALARSAVKLVRHSRGPSGEESALLDVARAEGTTHPAGSDPGSGEGEDRGGDSGDSDDREAHTGG